MQYQQTILVWLVLDVLYLNKKLVILYFNLIVVTCMKYILASIFHIFLSTSIFSQCIGNQIMTINDSLTLETHCSHKYYVTVNTITMKGSYINCSNFRMATSLLVKRVVNDSIDFEIQIVSYKSLTIRGLNIVSYFNNDGFYFSKEFKEEIKRLAPVNKVIIYEIVAKLPSGEKIILDPALYIME